MAVRGKTEPLASEVGEEAEGADVAAERVGAVADARDVRRDRREHVVAGEVDPVLLVVEAQVVEGVTRRVQRDPVAPGESYSLTMTHATRRVGWREQHAQRADHHPPPERRHRVLATAPRGLATPRHGLALPLDGRVVEQGVARV